MKGIGTDDDTLVRVVVTRCEIDMVQIKQEFQTLTGQTLEQYIAVCIHGITLYKQNLFKLILIVLCKTLVTTFILYNKLQ